MRRLAAILIGLILTLGAQAQAELLFSTSGGLTVTVPEGYLVAEIAPLRVGLTHRESGASILFTVVAADQAPEALMATELRLLGVGADQLQPRALSATTSNAAIVGTRGIRAAGSVLVAVVTFNEGSLALITIQPADSVPLPVVKSLVESVRLTRSAPVSNFPACGSPEIPQTITTSGGLSICFPDGFAAEEKGPTSAGVANLASGIIVSVYARADLQTLIAHPGADAQTTAAAYAGVLRAAGAIIFDSAQETIDFDHGVGVALPAAYPGVGSGRVIALQAGADVIVLSAVLIGTPPSDVISTLNTIANSASLGESSEDLGVVRPANRVIDLGSVRFTTGRDWALISQENGLATIERTATSALLSVAAAPLDSSWNAASYKQNVLAAAAQFAGDTSFDPSALEVVAQEDSLFTLEVYDSSQTVPDGSAAVNLTALLTLEGRAFAVFQVSVPRASFTSSIRDEVIQMALSAIR